MRLSGLACDGLARGPRVQIELQVRRALAGWKIGGRTRAGKRNRRTTSQRLATLQVLPLQYAPVSSTCPKLKSSKKQHAAFHWQSQRLASARRCEGLADRLHLMPRRHCLQMQLKSKDGMVDNGFTSSVLLNLLHTTKRKKRGKSLGVPDKSRSPKNPQR